MKLFLNKARKTATVDIDGESVTIRELSLADSQGVKRDGDDGATTTLRLIVASVVDSEGNKVYTDDDIPALRDVSLAIVKALGDAITDLNGLQSPKP